MGNVNRPRLQKLVQETLTRQQVLGSIQQMVKDFLKSNLHEVYNSLVSRKLVPFPPAIMLWVISFLFSGNETAPEINRKKVEMHTVVPQVRADKDLTITKKTTKEDGGLLNYTI